MQDISYFCTLNDKKFYRKLLKRNKVRPCLCNITGSNLFKGYYLSNNFGDNFKVTYLYFVFLMFL